MVKWLLKLLLNAIIGISQEILKEGWGQGIPSIEGETKIRKQRFCFIG